MNEENSYDNTTDEEWNRFGSWLKYALKTREINVTFIKKDGTERVMKCTLDPSLLPKKELKEDKKERKLSDTSLAVYDLEKKEWRSFVIKSIKRVDFTVK